MTIYGFSAFLKLLSSNPRPQRWQVAQRLSGGSGGGYDFHRSLRLRIKRYLVDREALEDLLTSADEIANSAEANSVKRGLNQLALWRATHGGEVIDLPSALYSAPSGLFKVNFIPDFGMIIDGRATAIHVWNTANPPLAENMIYAALSLLPIAYAGVDNPPSDFAVLSLVDGQLYRFSDRPDFSVVGDRVVAALEEVFRDVIEDMRLPPAGSEDRPTR